MKLAPKIYTIQNGQLKAKDNSFDDSQQSEPYRIIRYSHTIRATPDDYHTEQIKQYKEENQKLRKNYKDLQKAYWGLLGYCQDKLEMNGSQATPIHQMYKDGCPTSAYCESTSKESSAHISEFELDDMMVRTEDSRKKVNRLSESILEQQEIQEFRRNIKNEQAQQVQSSRSAHTDRSRNAKTEVDEDIEDLLIQAFKEVQELKELLESVKLSSSAEIEELKADYELKIQNLESMLEKERRQSRMLNGVINRMREELQSKQNFFKAVKQVKSGPEKHLIQRLLKQHRLSH